MKKNYKKGQFIKVKVTGIQPYGAFVETDDHTEGLIHISEVMNDYVHNLNLLLTVGQIVKAKVINVSEEGKLNLTLKENDYFKKQERKKVKRSVLEQLDEPESIGFETLEERLPEWIERGLKL
ncbi:S1 domain-containing post-transcriptional regulator Ygs [Macrococcus armenti]|uniref:S1 domain-containing post-transcriptional regulator Ygs n=1 Tax=Macrococcus armenti TaxID=2875764 RepID=UPI001CC9ED42|nr:S1 domain-containing post-transcriptional regulator Ygs [Macrococcus armenti]UBH09259.1 S1 RNA-binding domain-containing protein [Macrococcus armenti]UBH11555.1 S1 RNA-binding domain-containing protein [Macrococcus armenti]UBH13765.1 S1 RNA-binding domain-containing protein [Macrococcus armenti]UBH16021.1 S1 RNA-binding domain-containing protein [Macrococcus armenti]UBH18382.1 S1 RNA-binding domain-containing protein [Macrococcus armenti]